MRTVDRYRNYAEECRRLAKTMSKENGQRLLEIADAWLTLAKDVEKSPQASEMDEQ